MSEKNALWSEEKMDAVISTLLRFGVTCATAVVLVGGVVYLLHHGASIPEYRVFRGEPQTLTALGGIMDRASLLNGKALIQVGLLILVATPVVRVAFSVFAFASQRDWTYTAVTLLVLALLLASLFGLAA